ncbi:MAG: alcohol dehydrogenase catalytic domain-containing protein [Geminicoccaceae bacterium]|nr:alcohol dehydrogenase catalytic domain-containing protein [Geminicoccaceae bacterium]
MRIQAAVLRRSPVGRPYVETEPLAIETLDLDGPGPGEVLVRIHAAGLCHSDLSVINGDRPRPLPMALGHEASATVVETGAGVDDLAPGEGVVLVFVPSCGRCLPCAEGRAALCEPGAAANAAGGLLGGGRRLSGGGEPVHHHLGVSAFADHAVVSRRSLVKAEPGLALDRAALFGCAVLTGVGAVVNTGRVTPGQSVAVVGLGGVGLSAVLGAVAAGAARIAAVDLSPDRLAFARDLGATDAFDARDPDCAATIRAALDGGADVAVETAGAVAAFDTAYAATRRGGTTVSAGLANPRERLALQQVGLVAEERTVKGCYLGGGVPARDLPRLMRLHLQGRLPVERLMTSRGPLAGINAAFDALAEGRTVRHLIDMAA